MANENTNGSGAAPPASAASADAKKEVGHWIHAPRQVPAHLDPNKEGYWEGTVRTADGHQKTIRDIGHAEISEQGRKLIEGKK